MPNTSLKLPTTGVLSELLRHAPIRAYVKNVFHEFVDLNEACLEAMGLERTSKSSALGKTDVDFFTTDHASAARRDESTIFDSGSMILNRQELETWKDGRRTWVLTNKLPIFDDDRRVVGLIGISQNIDGIKKPYDCYRAAVESALDGLWYRDFRTHITWYSPRWKQILGYNDDELEDTYEEWAGRVHPEDQSLVQEALEKHIKSTLDPNTNTGKSLFECTYRMRHRSGDYRWVYARGQIERNNQSRIQSFSGSHTDITDTINEHAFYARVLEIIPTLVFVKNVNLKFSYVNTALANAFKCSKADLLGRSDGEIIANASQVRWFQTADRDVLETGRTSTFEETLTAGGRTLHLQTTKMLLQGPMPNLPDSRQVLGVANDVTALKQLGNDFSALMSVVPDRIVFKNVAGQFTRVNASFARLVGRPPGEVIGLTDADVFGEEFAAKYAEEEAHIFATGEPLLDVERVTPNPGTGKGTSVRLINKVPVFNGDGKVEQIICISKDITKIACERNELQRTYDELSKKTQMIEMIFNYLPYSIFVKNLEGKYTECNREFAVRHQAAEPAELYGKTDHDWSPPAYADRYMSDDQYVISTGIPRIRYRETVKYNSGRECLVETSKIPLFNSEGQVDSVLGIYQDITELVRQEEKRVFDDVARSIAHCVKNWIGILEGTVSNLRLHTRADDLEGPLRRLQTAIHYLKESSHLATHVYALSSGNMQRRQYIDVANMVSDIVAVFGDPRVCFVGHPCRSQVEGNEPHLRNCVHELLVNATRAIDITTGSVNVSVREREEDRTIAIEVSDNGEGVRPDLLGDEKLFTLFSSGSGKSTGIGLWYVKHVVDQHDGSIKVEPGLSCGTVMTIRLPLKRTDTHGQRCGPAPEDLVHR